ncbi:MAG: hypothetical protein KatS3mg050_4280 [Litorilinea sp.]|nr:MAG: hypothetical protein KatS3mg050_4280 [Litorilinea sp.]
MAVSRYLSPDNQAALAHLQAHVDHISHLRAHLFEPQAETVDLGPNLAPVEAPSREAEVRVALRAIKKLLLDDVPPQAIALLAPRPGAYGRPVETVAQEYGVPVTMETTLAANPAVAALLNTLSRWPSTVCASSSWASLNPARCGIHTARTPSRTETGPAILGHTPPAFAFGPTNRGGL